MKTKLSKAAAVLCALALAAAPVGACAAEWISLSDWAYAEVSGFVSRGLLPERLKSVTDFTRPVTRGEFAELIYSVLNAAGMFKNDVYYRTFEDCDDYPGANALYSSSIAYGAAETDTGTNFCPENTITREDAAMLVSNTISKLGNWSVPGYLNDTELMGMLGNVITDSEQVSEYARKSVYAVLNAGIMSGTGGAFEPKGELSIEQAVVIADRIYKSIPQLVSADEDEPDIDSGRDIGCGLTETYNGAEYVVSDNGAELMAFEADVYSKLTAAEHNGRRLICAVNFNDKTDVYDADTRGLVTTIPYIVYKAENGYLYVYSSRFMPAYSGLYSPDGTELIAPEYSEKELEAIVANNFEVPAEQRRGADGWIYYSDQNTGGSLCKTDTNGENTQCLVSGLDCVDTEYYKGKLYFKAKQDNALYRVDQDGQGLVKLAEDAELIWAPIRIFEETYYNEPEIYTDVNGNKDISDIADSYYIEKEPSFGNRLIIGERREYMREFPMGGGVTWTSGSDAYILYELDAEGDNAEPRRIADFPAYYITGGGEGRELYFLNADELAKNGDSPIYVYDGETLTVLENGIRVSCIGYPYDRGTSESDTEKLCYVIRDEIGANKYHVLDLVTGESAAGEFEEYIEEHEKVQVYDEFCTEDMKVTRGTDTKILSVEYNGEKTDLGEGTPIFREGSRIYYRPYVNGTYGGGGSATPMRSISSNALEVRVYDYMTGEDKPAASDHYLVWSQTDDVYTYATTLLMYRQLENGGSVAVYPNKGIFRYGEPTSFGKLREVIWQPGYLYKTDTDGNLSAVTDCDTEYWLYVPNGADIAEQQG